MISPAYKERLLVWLKTCGPCDTQEVKTMFPMAPLRDMERNDGTIEYVDEKWQVKEKT